MDLLHHKFVPKPALEFTEEDEKEVHKDKKAMNILFNGLDKNMFDNVIRGMGYHSNSL